MSGHNLPYRLRPNKFIDRSVFIDLLSRLVPAKGADKYIYISMGGNHLVDQNVVYRRVGIDSLFSFDFSERVVCRQMFNKPIDSAKCLEMDSGSLPGKIDEIAADFPHATNLVIWLDFTDPNKRLSQLQQLVEVAKRIQPGDVLRITMNAKIDTLDEHGSNSAWKEAGYSGPSAYRAERLRLQLGQFLPAEIEAVGEQDFPSVLCKCVELALSKAAGERNKPADFVPILLITYRDGQRMMTATALCCDAEERRETVGLEGWPFMPADWSDVSKIVAPDLSIREKLKIDERLSASATDIADWLGFDLEDSPAKSEEAIESYKRFHRYYPAFHHIDAM